MNIVSIMKVVLIVLVVVVSAIIGYLVGFEMCKRKLAVGFGLVFGSNPKLETEILEHIERYGRCTN